ncbi:MAG: hypothetical protein ACKO2P_04670 [Planctomycetota bacterium]
MIAPTSPDPCDSSATLAELDDLPVDLILLVRYGRVPQVARFGCPRLSVPPQRGDAVVVATERGQECGTVLHPGPRNPAIPEDELGLTGKFLRAATAADLQTVARLQSECDAAFSTWLQRAGQWQLQLQLIDLERTLDQRLILYVLNDRGPETTRLALLAAAAGHGVVHVQPASADGIVPEKKGGGCGDCGCSTH